MNTDGNYENTTIKLENGIIKKQFMREERFYCELFGLLHSNKTVLCPEIIEYDEQKLIIFVRYVEGKTINIHNASSNVTKKMAVALKALHGIKMNRFGSLYDVYIHDSKCKTWNNYLQKRFLARIQDIPTSIISHARLEDWFMSNLKIENDCNVGSLLHNDLKSSNILVSNGDIHLIDFDRCIIGDPLSDVAKMYWRMFNRAEDKKWVEFLFEYLQNTEKMNYKEAMEKICFYDLLHCMGAVAYYHFKPSEKYKPIYISALCSLKIAIGSK